MPDSMRNAFREHHRLQENEIKEIWKNCLFAFDTNVLLNIYRYAESTREDLFRVLRHLNDRIWVPHESAREFYARRLDVICEQKTKFDLLSRAISAPLSQLDDGGFRKSGFLQVDKLKDILRPAVEEALKFVSEQGAAHPDLVKEDPYLETLVDIIGSKIGEEPSQEDRETQCREAQSRIDRKQPPGYQDAQKPVSKRYGDILIWFELLQLGKEADRPIVFVTDDDKEDWWQIVEGQKLGPRPELREEMRKTAGVEFYLYNPARLLERVGPELDVSVSPSSIDDAKKIAEELQSRTATSHSLHPSTLPPLRRVLFQRPSDFVSFHRKAEAAVAQWLIDKHPNADLEPFLSPGLAFILSDGEARIGVDVNVLLEPAPGMWRRLKQAGYRAHYETNQGHLTKYLVVLVSPDRNSAMAAGERIFSRLVSAPLPFISVGYLDEGGRYQQVLEMNSKS